MAADRPARRRSPLVLVALACVALAAIPASSAAVAATAPAPRPSLPVIERQVMCVTCKIPLNVAESVQADRERAFIQGLIDEGRSEAQIKRALVSQYGPTVLGLPATSGFDLTAYLVPIVVVLTLVALLIVLLPRWRRRARAQAAALASPPSLPAEDAKRLDADLARFD
jgi:cytochrome c-type biogenesis protein CcmH